MSTARLEAFSDGVIAVAITLLVLDLMIPSPGSRPYHPLAYHLAHNWPDYAAYVVSFVTIGIIWINHHAAISRLARADHAILLVNLLLLMSIGVLPFATSLMARYLTRPEGEHLAAGIYAGAFLVMASIFSVLNWLILARRPHLMAEQWLPERRALILRRNVVGSVPYVVAVALAPVSAYACLAICGAVAAFYAMPRTIQDQ